MNKNKYMTVGIVPLYNPNKEELDNIGQYLGLLDFCLLMDDSESNNEELCEGNLKNLQDRYRYVWNGKNIGLCKSANCGIKIAIEMGAKWILIMNPDSRMNNDIISIFKEFLDKNDISQIALIAPQYNYDRHIREVKNGYKKVRFANMSGSFINTSVIKKIGAYDERCFIDGLDVEWCLRALRAGYNLIECSQAVLDHHPGHTMEFKVLGKTIFKYGKDSPDRYYYQFRSILLIHSIYHDLLSDVFGIYKLIKAMTLFDNRSEYKKAWKQAKIDFKAGYFGKRNGNKI